METQVEIITGKIYRKNISFEFRKFRKFELTCGGVGVAGSESEEAGNVGDQLEKGGGACGRVVNECQPMVAVKSVQCSTRRRNVLGYFGHVR